MKRLAILSLAIGLLIGFCAQANAQGCYGGSYQGSVGAPFGVESDTQEITVPVTVRVAVPRVTVSAPMPVAAPQSSCGNVGYSQPVAAPFVQSYGVASCAAPVGLSMAYAQPVGVAFNHHVGYAHHSVGVSNYGVSRGFVGGNFGAVGGTGVSITARDRRGTVVNATGATNVRIQRGLLGRINGANVDSNRGLLGRVRPF